MIKRLIAFLAVMFVICFGAVNVFASEHPSRVADGADVLTDAEENALKEKLDAISEKYDVDVAVVTVETLGGKPVADFTKSYYNDNGYGLGTKKSGAMLLFCSEGEKGNRDYYVYYNDLEYDSESVKNAVVVYLRDDNFVKAFDVFANESEYYIDIEINGAPFNFLVKLGISLVIGFVIAFICVSVMKGKLKSVHFQSGASTYQKHGSLKITNSKDIYLYRTVTRTARPKSTSSGGGGGGGSRSGGSGGKC